MADEGWVRLGDIEPGGLFETADGKLLAKRWTNEPYGTLCDQIAHPEVGRWPLWFPTDTPVRPLTAMPLHPSLRGSDLPGLCAAALREPNEGTYGRLLDWLGDALGRDPDAAAAVRERCLAVIEEETQRHPYNGLTPQETFRYLRDRIRAMGRPAATAAATAHCPTCLPGLCHQDGRTVIIDPETNQWVVCPACGGTGGATGEGVA